MEPANYNMMEMESTWIRNILSDNNDITSSSEPAKLTVASNKPKLTLSQRLNPAYQQSRRYILSSYTLSAYTETQPKLRIKNPKSIKKLLKFGNESSQTSRSSMISTTDYSSDHQICKYSDCSISSEIDQSTQSLKLDHEFDERDDEIRRILDKQSEFNGGLENLENLFQRRNYSMVSVDVVNEDPATNVNRISNGNPEYRASSLLSSSSSYGKAVVQRKSKVGHMWNRLLNQIKSSNGKAVVQSKSKSKVGHMWNILLNKIKSSSSSSNGKLLLHSKTNVGLTRKQFLKQMKSSKQ